MDPGKVKAVRSWKILPQKDYKQSSDFNSIYRNSSKILPNSLVLTALTGKKEWEWKEEQTGVQDFTNLDVVHKPI